MSQTSTSFLTLDGTARTTANLRHEAQASTVNSPELVLLLQPGAPTAAARRILPCGELLIGRDVAARELRIDDPSLSRLHARITFQPEPCSVELEDCESRNGTFVNGQRIRRCTLEDGDVVRMGETLFVFMEEEPMQRASEQRELAARTGLSVLLRGETGTGKEVFARAIHERSGRTGRFVALNCASLPKELIVAELFGHAKGAFSGAAQRRTGLFLAAEGGTLLLDEIGDCPGEVQVALLRALQEKTIRPLGQEQELAIDVQVIAATHRDLESAIEAGTFRADLYARLSQSVITLPPLRARRPQILSLFQTFAAEHGCEASFSADGAEALLLADHPFNVRGLQSIARLFAVAHAPSGKLGLRYLERDQPDLARRLYARREHREGPSTSAVCSVSSPRAHKRAQLKALLDEHQGNVSKVAELLGKPRAQIYRWLTAHGLSADSFREREKSRRTTRDVR